MSAFRLDAINQCLRAIGESPVNSVTSGVPDAESASQVIDAVTREVLQAGYSCNSVFNVQVIPDQDGIIKVAGDVLKIDTTGRSAYIAVTVRQDDDGLDKLFQVKDQSFKFAGPIYVDIVYLFDIDGLPAALQHYIAAKAARDFQETTMGAVSLDSFTSRHVSETWSQLLDYEAEQEDSNCLTDSYYMADITGRNNALSGR